MQKASKFYNFHKKIQKMYLLRCCHATGAEGRRATKYEAVNQNNSTDQPANKTRNGSTPDGIESIPDGIPLNRRQRFLLQTNWKAIARDMEAAGAELFVKLVV